MNKKKKLLSLILSMVMILSLFTVPANRKGICGYGLYSEKKIS